MQSYTIFKTPIFRNYITNLHNNSFEYLIVANKVQKEKIKKDIGKAEIFYKNTLKNPKIKVKSFIVQSDEYHNNIEKKLAHNLLSYGPIPIGIDSSTHEFELYSSGVMKKHHCGNDIDHAVLVVGYTPDYWIIKNSWGIDWGENGYFRLERGKNACGINSYASFVTSVKV